MRLLHHLSFLLRLIGGQTLITWRRIFRGPRVPGWTMAEERLHAMVRSFVAGCVRWGFPWARAVESRAGAFSPFTRRVTFADDRWADVAGARVTPKEGDTGGRCVLYLHGGGYCVGSVGTYREIIARLALVGPATAVAPEYRLAPEHPFPAGLEDCLAVYRELLARGQDPSELVVAGDSAGGGLVLSTLIAARDEGLPMPAGAVLFSPWVDPWGDERGSVAANARTDVLTREFAHLCRDAAFGKSRFGESLSDESLSDDPRAAPLHAELAGLPPVFLQVGALEILLDQDRELHRRLESAGVDVDYREPPLLFHTFQSLGSQVPRADQAVREAEAWIAERLASP